MARWRNLRGNDGTGRLTAAALTVGLALAGCVGDERDVTSPREQALGVSVTGVQDLDSALAVHRRHTARLIAIPGVVGTAVGLSAGGRPAIKILTRNPGVTGLPGELEGIPVAVQVTGELFATPRRAQFTPSGCTPSTCPPNTATWPLPVAIGISTGSNAFLGGFCFSGTIGARVTSGNGVYALSNNHVYALENTVALGTNVLQPGLADTQCSPSGSNAIGTLSAYAPIAFCTGASCPTNTIDAAIAASNTNNLDNVTPPAGYGLPNSVVQAASLGLPVQKYGRTTSLTAGQVTGIDATVTVQYQTGNAQFMHQILISSCVAACTGNGDSGSLWVTNDVYVNPVGLLFAGNGDGSMAIANQIGDVLAYFGVAVDTTPGSGLVACDPGFAGTCANGSSIYSISASGNVIRVTDHWPHTGEITLSVTIASGDFTPCDPGFAGTCANGSSIYSISASGHVISVTDHGGHTGTITLSGATASGAFTPCDPGFAGTCANGSTIAGVTASSSRAFTMTDHGGHTGTITLSGPF